MPFVMSQTVLFNEFRDIIPIPQDDGPFPVCSIDYDEEYSMAMDYMRAILRRNEFSERGLKLSELCLTHNPANYTLWHYRRQCLAQLSSFSKTNGITQNATALLDEPLISYDLTLTASLGGPKPKNYQIWYHRRMLLQSAFSLSQSPNNITSPRDAVQWARQELQYVALVLKEDEKNYHAWSHRQFILQRINDGVLWDEERHYVQAMIYQDVFNNSAWNQQWFVSHHGNNTVPLSSLEALQEIGFTLECAAIDPSNECPWRYLIGLIKEQRKAQLEESATHLIESCHDKIREMQTVVAQDMGLEPPSLVHMSCALIEILEFMGRDQDWREAADLAHTLGTVYDSVRIKYWLKREEQCRSKC